MPVKVQLVMREAKTRDPRQAPAPRKNVAPLKVREAADAALAPVPKARSVGAFLCDRKEPQGRP